MSSLSCLCGPRLWLNPYFYESLLKRPSVLMMLGLKSATHRADSSLLGFFWNSVFGFVCTSECMYFALTCVSVKSSVWSQTGWIWDPIADRSWAIAANQRHDALHTPDSGFPAQPGSEPERLIRLTQPRPAEAARLSSLVLPSLWRRFERALSDVGLKLVWTVDDGGDWWLLILTFPCIKRPSPKREWELVPYRDFILKTSHSSCTMQDAIFELIFPAPQYCNPN